MCTCYLDIFFIHGSLQNSGAHYGSTITSLQLNLHTNQFVPHFIIYFNRQIFISIALGTTMDDSILRSTGSSA
jgi:hypothetical protein